MNAPRQLRCSNCRAPLRTLALSSHYQQAVDIDVCDACCLIWFDGTESVRLAGPSVAALVHVIHAAMSGRHDSAMSITIAQSQACPICAAGLTRVFNQSRFGRTSQLQCPHGHGYLQSYTLYLAEKGFIHPIRWSDIKQLKLEGRALHCAACGASLKPEPYAACPYCQSTLGVVDPARLASAIDLHQLAGIPAAPPASAEQAHCGACGGSVDPTRDVRCPHCQAVLRRDDTALAAQASEAVEDAVRRNHGRQLAALSRIKLAAQNADSSNLVYGDAELGARWTSFRLRLMAAAAVLTVLMLVYAISKQFPGVPASNGAVADKQAASDTASAADTALDIDAAIDSRPQITVRPAPAGAGANDTPAARHKAPAVDPAR